MTGARICEARAVQAPLSLRGQIMKLLTDPEKGHLLTFTLQIQVVTIPLHTKIRILLTECICVSFGSHSKQRLFL
jgi:hypothetical protein